MGKIIFYGLIITVLCFRQGIWLKENPKITLPMSINGVIRSANEINEIAMQKISLYSAQNLSLVQSLAPNVLFMQVAEESFQPRTSFWKQAGIYGLEFVATGVGNIYSDEALFRAGIRPTRRANGLKIEEIFKLLIALKEVLQKGIENSGTTVSDYKRTDGRKGNFQNFLYVYRNEGKPCSLCGTTILLKKMGSRSTRYCPRCQK